MIPNKLLMFFSLLLFLGFIFFSYLVAKERFVQFDFATTVKLQDHISRKFDAPFSIFSVIGSAEITGLFWGLILIWCLIRKFWLTAASLFLLPVALITEIFGKVFVYHPSPPYLFYRGVIDFNFPSHYVHAEYSYPSGHMLRTSFLITFLIVYLSMRVPNAFKLPLNLVLAGFLAIMGISRIYLGEHWFSDVFGGALIGASFGIFTGATIPKKRLVSNHSRTV